MSKRIFTRRRAGIAVPIALASEHRGRNLGLLLVLFAAFAYYALAAVGEGLAESRQLPAGLASWLPNLLFAALAVPIALASEHRARNLGVLLVLATAFGYYALGAVAEGLAESRRLSPAGAGGLPNVLCFALAAVLIVRGRNRIAS